MIKKIIALVKHEIAIELRNQYSFFGVLLYVAATTFLLYLAIENPDKKVWTGLYWIILLFASVNAIAKSFLQISKGRLLYYYTISNAATFIIAKIIYNLILMFFIGIVHFVLIQLFLGNPIVNSSIFLFSSLLGILCFGVLFTLLSAIAAKANQNAALVAILGFPLVLPLLLILIKVSNAAIATNLSNYPTVEIAILSGYFLLLLILSVVLYPFLWKD
jgi:heme exporter protein B